MLRTVGTRSVVGHAHVMRRRGGRTVGGTNSRVVLRATPAQAHSRVANGVALHLVDGHFRSVAVHELHEATALARGDLDVGDLSEALEEGSELILGDVAREPADKHGSVVGIGELVHLGCRIVATVGEALHPSPHGLLRNAAHHRSAASVVARSSESVVTAESAVSDARPRLSGSPPE